MFGLGNHRVIGPTAACSNFAQAKRGMPAAQDNRAGAPVGCPPHSGSAFHASRFSKLLRNLFRDLLKGDPLSPRPALAHSAPQRSRLGMHHHCVTLALSEEAFQIDSIRIVSKDLPAIDPAVDDMILDNVNFLRRDPVRCQPKEGLK